MKIVMRRVARTAGIGIAALGMLLGTAGVASADEQSYLDSLAAHGMTYGAPVIGIASPALAIRGGNDICANIRYSGDPRAGFNPLTNASIPDYMIDAAQHELCPETLGGAQ
ncbi:hypothetical protein [Mycobacterium sp. SMC-19]|uniref:hypothetical protein n=1 Tax=Mycobacterium sp. SMC-19 TaxID=3381630 RepID=UPI0038773406